MVKNHNILISFVIPCYRSEFTILKVIDEIIDTIKSKEGYDYEIIAVNDASPDNVYSVLESISNENEKVKVVNLVKNMGKHAAILAGYHYIKGEYIVNLDDDYQSPVENLWVLLEPLENGDYDVATASFIKKKESLWKRVGSRINLLVSDIMLDKPKGIRFENFSVIKRFVAYEVIKYKNPFPYLDGLIFRVTNRILSVPMDQRERADNNKSGFSFKRSLSLFSNGFTNFSVKPLRIALVIGLLFSFFGFVGAVVFFTRKILYPEIPIGWSSNMVVILLSNGITLLMLGLIGEYVGRILICINDAPQYVVNNTINISRDDYDINTFGNGGQ